VSNAQGSEELLELADLAAVCARELAGDIDAMTSMVLETLASDGALLFCGNGGSAADAQHLAAEYVVRFRRERGPLRAVALTTDTSILTAGGNDFGFEEVFARQVHAVGRQGDLLFVHSTSGDSENLIRAVQAAGSVGIRTVALLAKGGGRLKDAVDLAVIVPTDSTAHAQEIHLAMGHAVCDRVDQAHAAVS
jgi:D-sedoheptulose 7-phosphate isomerase